MYKTIVAAAAALRISAGLGVAGSRATVFHPAAANSPMWPRTGSCGRSTMRSKGSNK
jgi:hypothetical protein